MVTERTPIDFIAYDADGTVVLLAEAKSRRGTSNSWAAKLRHNILSHGELPRSQYFLIATPERMYGWRQENLPTSEVLPQFTVDTQKALAPYFGKMNIEPTNIGPRAFELLIHTWLTDIARSERNGSRADASLIDSGLLASLQKAEIAMNAAR